MANETRDEETTYLRIANTREIPPGGRILVDVSGVQISVFNIDGQLFAIGDECTHEYSSLCEGELTGYEITCPRHGARFDIRTGKALSLPAIEDTPIYPVRITGEDVELGEG